MKNTLFTLLTSVVLIAASALGQGKINMVNDSNHLLYFGPTIKASDAAYAGQAIPAGSLPSGSILLVDLFGGTSAGNMTLQTTVAVSPSIPGRFGPMSFTSPNLPGGQVATMQIKVRESGFATAELALAGGGYSGFSQIFTMKPSSTIAFNSIVNPGGSTLSTWSNGTYNLGALGLGAIEVGFDLGFPGFFIHPLSGDYVLGTNITLSALSYGSGPLSYQWRKNGSPLAGATNTSITLSNLTLADAGNYNVTASNSYGMATSGVATITILSPPTIVQSPQNQVAINGGNTFFSVVAGGSSPLSYQWRKDGVNIGGGVSTNFTITSVTTSNVGDYDVVVINPYGAVTSALAHLTIVFPPSINTQPTSQVVATGGGASFNVTAAGNPPLSYQWFGPGGILPEATNALFMLNSALTNNSGNYYAVVSNPFGQSTSSIATLAVFIPVTIYSNPASQVVTARTDASFSVGAYGYPTLNYQWLFNGVDILGATGSSIVLTNIGTNALGDYQVEVWNAYSAATSAPAALFMSPSFQTSFNGLVGTWGKQATLTVAAWGSGELSYQWFKGSQPVNGATNATLVFPSLQISDGGLYSVVVTSPYGNTTNTPAQLVVNPANVSLGLAAMITIEGVAGYTYGIEYTTDLQNTNSWQSLTNITLTQPTEIWVDTSVEVLHSQRRFYRVTGQ